MLDIKLHNKTLSINLDYYIILLMFLLIPIDMLNGVLITKVVSLPITVGQAYKLFIIFLILFRLFTKPLFVNFFFLLISLLFIPTIYQLFKTYQFSIITKDIIKIFRYTTPILSFVFFATIYKSNNVFLHKKINVLVAFSFYLTCASILLKYVGFGYPMYNYGNIGSKGFFYAGNEISVLLLIMSAFLAKNLWVKNFKINYFFTFLLSFITALGIGSKTALFGILLIFFLIPIKRISLKTSLNKFIFASIAILILIPSLLVVSWEYIKRTELYIRVVYFYEKLDFITFLLSNRNTFLIDAVQVYINDYNWLEKLIGVGQSTFETKNGSSIIEIDFIDIFFAFGFIGLLIFIGLIIYLWKQSKRLAKSPKFNYASFVNLMLFILVAISSTAGHVFSSGLAAIFIGLTFAIMFKKNIYNETN
ncbi:hypothetical protein GCM10010831_00190 [Psychroflexus salis]|uniref:O-Antigen ligase n=1 Tax=Psychroflexus salis TaxID=1526574 RepID=A0A917E5S6_9FLAO|nr:hypothetical protein GCM10010831_00190 [Psychroflexus salis]